MLPDGDGDTDAVAAGSGGEVEPAALPDHDTKNDLQDLARKRVAQKLVCTSRWSVPGCARRVL